MTWNWQHKDWPQFIYSEEDFRDYERVFISGAGVTLGSVRHVARDDYDALKINLISDEAYKTSEIEGEILNRQSLQSSIKKQFGLQTDYRKIPPAEQGIAEMMVDLYRNYAEPLSDQTLCSWHRMLMNGHRDLEYIGDYREHDDPMQIVSGSIDRPKVHFEAPPSKQVKPEIKQFIRWFNTTSFGGRNQLPVLLRSGIAHLYFESIHPFEDGNGRIGRAISEKALSQYFGRPTLIAISSAIQNNRKAYYQALHDVSVSLHISQWLHYFCEMVLEAQARTQSVIDFLVEKGKFYQYYNGQFNERQRKVIKRIFEEGISGFKGGLSAENYLSITGTTRATATRDLQKLVEIGAFKRKGELRYTRYYLNIDHPSVNTD
ncbi:MAG: Fic family protein [Bacteroidota bacterium]